MPKDKTTPGLFKQAVPKMPEGYYSGDKPNPNLRAFVEQHLKEKPYNPATDDYDVPAFAKPIDTTKATAIYNLHTYWSKKPHDAIRQYIEHYTNLGDLVLDPFSGSGGTSLAALMAGRKAIAIDRSPAATFISKNYCTPVDSAALKSAFEDLEATVRSEIEWLYETRCHLTGKKAQIAYVVYSQVFKCQRCLEKVALFDCVEVEAQTAKGKKKTISLCPKCHKNGLSEQISTRDEKFGCIPVLVNYFYKDGEKNRRVERSHNDANPKAREFFAKFDITKLSEIESKPIPYWHPTTRMMNLPAGETVWGILYRPGVASWSSVDQVFTKRNLWALALLRHHAKANASLLFTLNAALLNCSRMYRHRETGGGGPAGSISIPQTHREMNVWDQFASKFSGIYEGTAEVTRRLKETAVCISTQSSTDMAAIPDSSIDYIFTDPPYGDKFPYGELNFIWESFLNLDCRWHADEIIVNSVQGKSEADWSNLMRLVLQECFRVLRPGRWLSICYHDTSEGTWEQLQQMLNDIGFVADTSGAALFIDTGQKSIKQVIADKVTKRDLVINFRKPKQGEGRSGLRFTGEEDQQTFRQKAQGVMREFLKSHPGTSIDRVYDEVVSRLVRKGQMEAHNFSELLRQVADEVKQSDNASSRWYLKDTEAGAQDAERTTADNAGACIYEFLCNTTTAKLKQTEPKAVQLQAEVARRRHKLQAVDQGKSLEPRPRLVRELRELGEQLDKLNAQRAEWERQASDYSQIFEFYIATVNPKPRTSLLEILEDYCYQTEEGNWRPPLTEQEKTEKSSERSRAVRRNIQHLFNLLEGAEAVAETDRPETSTLAEWIRHCRRTGLHAQGKLLYERGGLSLDQLSEEDQVTVQEDYDVCVRALARAAGKQTAKASKQQNMNL